MVTTNFDLRSTEGLRAVRALCSCLGTNTTTLRMTKAGSLTHTQPVVTIPHMSKTVTQRSKVLDTLVPYNLVVCTSAAHSKDKQMYTYTVTGFGLSVLSELFGVQFYVRS